MKSTDKIVKRINHNAELIKDSFYIDEANYSMIKRLAKENEKLEVKLRQIETQSES